MLKRAANSEQLQLLRRLRFAGCPVDPEHLPQPRCPLRDFRQAGVKGTNIIPIADGYGIIFGIKALACAALTVCRFDLRANWFKQPISWIKPCDQHPNRYCFQQRSGDHTVWSSDDVLTGRPTCSSAASISRGACLADFMNPCPHRLEKRLRRHSRSQTWQGTNISFQLRSSTECPKQA